MRKRSSISIATPLLLGALVAGCASPATSSVPPADVSLRGDAGGNADLFVSDFYAAEVLIYPAHVENPSPSGSITDGISDPYNLAVDTSGTLYVQNNNNTITEYPKGASSPSKTLYEPKLGSGAGICVTVGRDGTVYSADHLNGQVFEFLNGDSQSSRTLDVSKAFGLALDSRNNLYVGWSASSSGASGHVMKFKHGATSGKDLGITVKYSGGLAIDKHDNLLVGDQGNQVIGVFKKHATQPFRMIDVAPNYPYQFAFDKNEKHLYMVSGDPAEVYVYDYATGELAWTVTQGLPGSGGYAEGVAVRPVAPQ